MLSTDGDEIMNILTDEVEIVCHHCNKHFAIKIIEDKQGIKS